MLRQSRAHDRDCKLEKQRQKLGSQISVKCASCGNSFSTTKATFPAELTPMIGSMI